MNPLANDPHITRESTASFLPRRRVVRPNGIGLIGYGAFGRFAAPHLARVAPVLVHDPNPSTDMAPCPKGVSIGDIAAAASLPVVVLAPPVHALEACAVGIRDHLVPGALVIDVCSIKSEPVALLRRVLPHHVDIVGTHPLFGPMSGRDGIAGLGIAICGKRRSRLLSATLADLLALVPIAICADDHDRDMAYVQGLTHAVVRAFAALPVRNVRCRTATYDLLERMRGLVGGDSDALFRAVVATNPHAAHVVSRFAAELGRLAEMKEPTL